MPHKSSFLRRHGLSISSAAILVTWTVLYIVSDPQKHWGSFFGNAIADWSGVVVVVLATKIFFERGSEESRQRRDLTGLRAHSLTIFLVITGAAWVALFARMDPNSRWGQVMGNIVSEWTQVAGLVLLTKRLREIHSRE